jgi:hypothetical protein
MSLGYYLADPTSPLTRHREVQHPLDEYKLSNKFDLLFLADNHNRRHQMGFAGMLNLTLILPQKPNDFTGNS